VRAKSLFGSKTWFQKQKNRPKAVFSFSLAAHPFQTAGDPSGIEGARAAGVV
jgi:hypothetical protein